MLKGMAKKFVTVTRINFKLLFEYFFNYVFTSNDHSSLEYVFVYKKTQNTFLLITVALCVADLH